MKASGILLLLLVLLLLQGSVAPTLAQAEQDVVREASELVEDGHYDEAETLLLPVVRQDSQNLEARRLLARAYRRSRHFTQARALYDEILTIAPTDRDARNDLASLRRQRGMSLTVSAGNGEADSSATQGWQAEGFYGGVNFLDAYVGSSYSDQFFYTRRSHYGRFYAFYSPTGYVKLALGQKTYDYPQATNPVPDANSYRDVPRIEVEIGDRLSSRLLGSLTYEFFRPNFFFAQGEHAQNHKLSGELAWLASSAVRLRLLTAILRDPDPDATVISRETGTVTRLEYGTQFLLGGGAGIDLSKIDAELLVLPNRDLDRSLDISFIGRVSVPVANSVSLTGDVTFDRYSDESSFQGQDAQLYMLAGSWQAHPKIRLTTGVKWVDRPLREDTGVFLTARIQTGLP